MIGFHALKPQSQSPALALALCLVLAVAAAAPTVAATAPAQAAGPKPGQDPRIVSCQSKKSVIALVIALASLRWCFLLVSSCWSSSEEI